MASDRQESNATRARPIRIDQDLWDAFEVAAGSGQRSKVIVEFIRWYVHAPHSRLPKRSERPDASDTPKTL